MRVIGGTSRRRRLAAPASAATRPILDRVKQALFDALGPHFGCVPGVLPSVQTLDLYCGGGTLGLEALSRGAAGCTFVERDRDALAALRTNIIRLNAADRARVIAADATTVAIPPPPAGRFALVFLDPPFPDSATAMPGSPIWRLLERLAADPSLAGDALCVWRFESGRPAHPAAPPGWRLHVRRHYGRNELAFLMRCAS